MDYEEVIEVMGWDYSSIWVLTKQFFDENKLTDKYTEFLRTKAKEEDEMCKDTGPEDPIECSLCSGLAGLMGVLGNRAHYRCRGCGAEFSKQIESMEEAWGKHTSTLEESPKKSSSS